MIEKELVSLILCAYNQEQFIREAAESALRQTYSPLEIVFSDDCSTDRTFAIIEEEASKYKGHATIILNRNEHNLGNAGNMNIAVTLSHGRFIVDHAGDDISYPERVEKLYMYWKKADPPVDLICSYYEEIDAKGNLTGYRGIETYTPDISKNALTWKCAATGATESFSRKLFEKYGPLNPKVISEDWVLPFRAWLESGVAIVKEPLIKHRTHSKSLYVLGKTLKLERNSTIRKYRRFQLALSDLGIAEEWLHAWKIEGNKKPIGKKENMRIYSQLQKLVKLKKMYVEMFNSSRIKALIIMVRYFYNGGGFKKAAKHFALFVLKWQ